MAEHLQVVAAVIAISPEFVLVARKRPGADGQAVWEFPGGKVEPGESPESALVREVDEELGIRVQVLERLDSIPVEVDGGEASAHSLKIDVHFYACAIVSGMPLPHEHDALQILRWEALPALDFHEADHLFVEREISRRSDPKASARRSPTENG